MSNPRPDCITVPSSVTGVTLVASAGRPASSTSRHKCKSEEPAHGLRRAGAVHRRRTAHVYGQGAATHHRLNRYALVDDPARRQARSLGGSGPAFGDDPAVPRTTAKRPWPRAEFEPKKNHAGRVTGSRAKTARLRRGHPGRFYRVYRM